MVCDDQDAIAAPLLGVAHALTGGNSATPAQRRNFLLRLLVEHFQGRSRLVQGFLQVAAEGEGVALISSQEFDLEAGRRGRRDLHAEALLQRLLGVEAAVVVNNNAAATLLMLAALAAGHRWPLRFGDRVYRTMIPRNVRLGEAPSFGKPITLYDPHCIGAASYCGLAREILGDDKEGARQGT